VAVVRVGAGVIGVLVALVGAVFAGQGLGYIAGSVMTNDIKWFWIGLVMVLLGLALAAWSFISRPRSRT
jgi:hypothetical protein